MRLNRTASLLVKFYRNIKLRTKIFLAYSILMIVSIGVLGFYAYNENVKVAEEKILDSITGSMEQSSENLERIFSNAERQINLFSTHYTIQGALLDYSKKGVVQKYNDYRTIEKLTLLFEKSYDILSIRLFFTNEEKFWNDNYTYFNYDKLFNKNEMQRFLEQEGVYWKSIYTLEHPYYGVNNVITLTKKVVNLNDSSDVLAALAFDISEQSLRKTIKNIPSVHKADIFIIDKQGRAVSSLNGNLIKSIVVNPEIIENVINKNIHTIKPNNNSSGNLTAIKEISNYPFYIVANIPNDEITKGGLQILKKFSFIAIIILIISFLIAYVISNSITKRIKQLIDVMANVENSKFSVQVPVIYNDEISVLKRNFNWMIERIRNLIDAVYKSNIEKKEAELKLLQAQINPHFLYNTLDSINWLAVRTDASEISYIVKNLSDYLRIGLNKGEDMTSIENEIKHIYAYFNIQKFRFEDKVNLEVNIASEILKHKTITLVLQPLIENAILHGILKEEGRKGVITITAEEIEGMIILEVKDNGIGIEKDTLLKILENMNNFTNADMGYGLRNVHQRIRYKFGEEYGLNIISEKDKGTSCLLIFPAI